jgi:hypothetical protein
LLGHPDDASLLIVNADDFGMCDSVNDAIAGALGQGIPRRFERRSFSPITLMYPLAFTSRLSRIRPGTVGGH